MINMTIEFWERHVHSNQDRQMLLQHAREYFPDGFDIVILRQVVRSSISKYSPTFSEKTNVDSDRENIDQTVKKNVTEEDSSMINSIQWLWYFPEYRVDALICSNMILRKLLLQSTACKEKY